VTKRKGTETSAFGTSGRISHDSSTFYDSRLYKGLKPPDQVEFVENQAQEEAVNKLFAHTSEKMPELLDNSVHLMVTSPPYNASKEYDDDLTLEEYLAVLQRVMSETYRVLVTGGRACINLANLGRKPYIPLHAYVIEFMLELGYYMRGEIIWDKGASASSSTAWGTWMSAVNPVLRDVHEYILIFSKGSFSRKKKDGENSITRDAFLENTKSVWSFPAESACKIGHPAPFPEELPQRLIQLYTFEGDLVLDPFCGSGTTCVAARRAGRRYVGYDVNQDYLDLASSRLEQLDDELAGLE
jgi:site-specific DNA-methyltransferase (adenine-specific)